MSKRSVKNSKKLFNFDLDSVFDVSQEEKNEPKTTGDSQPKKLKTKDTKPVNDFAKPEDNFQLKLECNETEDGNDFENFFQNIGSDFNKSIKGRKMKLNQFADSVISLHQTKLSDLLIKMDEEVEAFKERASNNIQEELNKFDSEFNTLQLHENKLMKILEQQIKLVQKMTKFQEHWSQTFAKVHQNFFQEYSELKLKHKNEISEMKKSIESDVITLQNKFISETKKEEMQTMKSYINSIYF